jgi:hypothetical protein
MRDDLEFDNEMIIGDVQPEIQQQAPVHSQSTQINQMPMEYLRLMLILVETYFF